ncbi:Calcineurin-like metallo-phosphoesterase superfamily protein [Actinidia rufa]|uniref:Calcineurin-like metallo-phosphoesterase superfamily protein n=1 Tax=Actinidia rufa TaxID=165716 RepID=A0A7J0FEZ9_9ERIC|nr:Calcineurin-like metallo-phosphoesterase superfamily protein [Actinidia rufa]
MWSLTAFLCVVWAATLLYGEMFAFWMPSLWSCSWPHLRHQSSSINQVEYSSDYVKVAVVADPQVMDRTSLHLAPKSLAMEIAKFYTDLFMRRAILASVLPFQPDVILFLGDHFDGGPSLSDEEWQESLSRFKHIFNLNMLEKNSKTQVYYLPGNHDIGYAAFHSNTGEVIERYEKEFGSRNYQFTVGKVDFIAIDAQTIDDIGLTPRVLLTHIPLYRPDRTYCGPHRSSSIINQVLILSGHDHDQCTVTHLSKYGQVTEHTLGTISWQQGNLYPSFMLLSASNLTFHDVSRSKDAVLTQLCFLPAQTYIYIWYLTLFVLTLLVLLLWPTNGIGFSRHFGGSMEYIRSLISCIFVRNAAKEKNEDENCEYEMVWDAEGSMHLIKKTLKAPTKVSSDKGLVERGNAVIRPTAKKQMSQETDASVSLDVNIPVGSDATVKLSHRTNKSKAKMVIRRLVRTLRGFTVIAAVNVPLYMMLLFKDWVDK